MSSLSDLASACPLATTFLSSLSPSLCICPCWKHSNYHKAFHSKPAALLQTCFLLFPLIFFSSLLYLPMFLPLFLLWTKHQRIKRWWERQEERKAVNFLLLLLSLLVPVTCSYYFLSIYACYRFSLSSFLSSSPLPRYLRLLRISLSVLPLLFLH